MMVKNKQNKMVRMLKRGTRARREHGIALLFTLCILSMALITAMIFSTNASTGRKVASAYVDSSAARILADGVVNRAILALMQSENASYVCSSYKTNPPTGNANDYASDWIWKLEKNGLYSFNDGPIRFNKAVYYDREDSRCPSWEYVYNKNIYGDPNTSTERIYGRFAYVAIGQNDQLNPNALGRRDGVDNSILQKRLGRYTCEPQFIFKSTRNNWNYSSVISPNLIRDKYTAPDGWEDLDVFVNDLLGTASGGAGSNSDKQLKMMADQYFDVSGQGEYNKFRSDGQPIGDLSKHGLASGESYRFPLIRNDWDSISFSTVKDSIPWFKNASGANVNQTVANLINYNASFNRPPVTDNDNWIGGEPTYTGNKRTPYINEVHAVVSVGGNLGVRMAERYLADPNNPSSWKWRVWYTDCTYSHEITINVETVNMYSLNDGVLSVRDPILVGTISYDYWNANGDGNGFWSSQTIQIDANTQWTAIDRTGNDAGYKVYAFQLDRGSVGSMTTPKRDNYDRPVGHEADFYEHVRIRNVRLSLDRVVLQDNTGRNADLALMPQGLQGGRVFLTGNGEQVAGAGDFGRHFYFDTQANDPRQNLGRNDWSTPLFSEKETEVSGTIGNMNSAISLGSYHDNEKRTDPAYAGNDSISTAYIRHAPMQSLWELGAIHRGSPWQTINLKCAAAKGTRMEAYQNGDGHLLDQVALTSSTQNASDWVLGMINLNCVATFGGNSAPFAFKSLFTNFPVYKTYAAMNSYTGGKYEPSIKGDSVDSNKSGNMDADALAADLSEAVTYAISQGNYLRRTAVFPTSYPASGQMENIIKQGVPDAEAEEIFCRVVNLLKWNKQPLKRATILVLAQTIKDIGGVSLERNMPDRDLDLMRDAGFLAYKSGNVNSYKTAPSAVTAATVRSSYAKRAVTLKQYDNFYDQITGEAKIIVRLEWDESANGNKGAWKVTRKEYAE